MFLFISHFFHCWWRRLQTAALVLGFSLFAMGLSGSGGGIDEAAIPVPEQNFRVLLEDTQGRKVEAERVTWEGKVFLRAQYGKAVISLPFSNLRLIERSSGSDTVEGRQIPINVTLRSGDTLVVGVERSSKCYGKTKFGNYEIFFKDLRRIEFLESDIPVPTP